MKHIHSMHVYKVQSILQELVLSQEILFDFLTPTNKDNDDINRCFHILTELSKHILVKIKGVEEQEGTNVKSRNIFIDEIDFNSDSGESELGASTEEVANLY